MSEGEGSLKIAKRGAKRNGRGQTKKNGVPTGETIYYIARATVCQYNARRVREYIDEMASGDNLWRWRRRSRRCAMFTLLRHYSAGNLSFARKNDYSRLNALWRSHLPPETHHGPVTTAKIDPFGGHNPSLSPCFLNPLLNIPLRHCQSPLAVHAILPRNSYCAIVNAARINIIIIASFVLIPRANFPRLSRRVTDKCSSERPLSLPPYRFTLLIYIECNDHIMYVY